MHEGQTIRIPASLHPADVAVSSRSVTVESGDTLWGIAARDLGEGQRWHEIFELSEGATAPDGHILRDPNLIWPGLVVEEPMDAPSGDEQPQSQPDVSGVSGSVSQPADAPAVGRTPAVTPTAPVSTPATPATPSPGAAAISSEAAHVDA